jgi:uncharacterized protein YaeQ
VRSSPPVRIEYRVTVADVDRNVEAGGRLIVEQGDEEPTEHLTLRVLAWCAFHEAGLEMGPGVHDPDGADLWSHDPTGRVSTWIECGATSADKLRRVSRHRRGARVRVLHDSLDELARLATDLARGTQRVDGIELWLIDPELVERLASQDLRRHAWSVTIVGGRLYVDADALPFDGALTRI